MCFRGGGFSGVWSKTIKLPFFWDPSLIQLFVKLGCFLRLFLKTRSHDGSAHTFGSSHKILEVLQKGVKQIFVSIFFTTFFLHVWSYQICSNYFKSPRSRHERRPIYGLNFVYIDYYYPLYKKGFFRSKMLFSCISGGFWPF